MSLGRFCPLAAAGERLGLLGTKPHKQRGSGCVGHSHAPGTAALGEVGR